MRSKGICLLPLWESLFLLLLLFVLIVPMGWDKMGKDSLDIGIRVTAGFSYNIQFMFRYRTKKDLLANLFFKINTISLNETFIIAIIFLMLFWRDHSEHAQSVA